MNSTTRVTFLPRAHALLNGTRWESSQARRLSSESQLGDVVVVQGIAALFEIVQRTWTIAPDGETLELVLDLAERPPIQTVP